MALGRSPDPLNSSEQLLRTLPRTKTNLQTNVPEYLVNNSGH
jgi:hypothetical protein